MILLYSFCRMLLDFYFYYEFMLLLSNVLFLISNLRMLGNKGTQLQTFIVIKTTLQQEFPNTNIINMQTLNIRNNPLILSNTQQSAQKWCKIALKWVTFFIKVSNKIKYYPIVSNRDALSIGYQRMQNTRLSIGYDCKAPLSFTIGPYIYTPS